jgi:hypothetical protein
VHALVHEAHRVLVELRIQHVHLINKSAIRTLTRVTLFNLTCVRMFIIITGIMIVMIIISGEHCSSTRHGCSDTICLIKY